MKKNTLNLRGLVDKYQANCDRISAIADTCEKEQRERNEAENAEFTTLVRENQLLQMRMQAHAAEQLRENPTTAADANRIIRENMTAGRQTQIMLMRDMIMVSDARDGGIVPLKMSDVIDPLVEGLILEKVGLPLPTGLAGDYVWPTYEAVEATVAGEGIALTDTKIPLSMLTAIPQRVGIAVPVTRQTIQNTDGFIESIVKKAMPLAIAKTINKIMFSTTRVTNATTLVGPFVALASKTISMSKIPTYADYCKLKAKVLESGVDGENLCFVMTKAQMAIAESTPKASGSGVMICEDGKIAGIPVFTTSYIGEGYVGLGDWRYQPMGLFGDMSFIVDPYSQARKDAVDFVLNVNYGTTTLVPGAFALGKLATS